MTPEEFALAEAVTNGFQAGLSAADMIGWVTGLDPHDEDRRPVESCQPVEDPAPDEETHVRAVADHECRSLAQMITAREDGERLRTGDLCCVASDHGGAGCRCAHDCHVGDPEHPFAEAPF